MALGMNPRFDLTQAYWVQAGIGGANPDVTGSAVWEPWIVTTAISAHRPHQLEQPAAFGRLHRTAVLRAGVPTGTSSSS